MHLYVNGHTTDDLEITTGKEATRIAEFVKVSADLNRSLQNLPAWREQIRKLDKQAREEFEKCRALWAKVGEEKLALAAEFPELFSQSGKVQFYTNRGEPLTVAEMFKE